jgi:hypothetical protein
VPGPDPAFPGSPLYQKGKVSAENRVAQHGNLALWLVRDGASPWSWVVPESVKVSEKSGVTFLECERTWVALRPLGASAFQRDEVLTAKIGTGEKPAFPGHQVLAARGSGGAFCGVAVEVGEKESHGSFDAFQAAVLKAEVDRSKLTDGVVQYKAADGKWLGLHWNDDPLQLGVWRNGKRRDLARDAGFLYRAGEGDGGPAPVHSKWSSGSIYVEAGGEAFGCSVDGGGGASFASGKPADLRPRFAP